MRHMLLMVVRQGLPAMSVYRLRGLTLAVTVAAVIDSFVLDHQ